MEQKRLREHALRDIKKDAVDTAVAVAAHRLAWIRDPPGTGLHLRQLYVGAADSVYRRTKKTGEPAPADAGADRRWRPACRAGRHRAWFSLNACGYVGETRKSYDKVTDVEGRLGGPGLSFECVGTQRTEIAAPVDLYLEARNTARGLVSNKLRLLGGMSEALYERLLPRGPHSWLCRSTTIAAASSQVDLGNVDRPQKVMNSLGAEC